MKYAMVLNRRKVQHKLPAKITSFILFISALVVYVSLQIILQIL